MIQTRTLLAAAPFLTVTVAQTPGVTATEMNVLLYWVACIFGTVKVVRSDASFDPRRKLRRGA
jgi:hypothetical protein